MKRATQSFLFLVCVLVSVAAAYNVMSDNVEVERMAKGVACGDQGPDCNAQMTRMERTPIGQTFAYATPKRSVDVRCTRALYLVGDYACELR